jgi:sigma-E factor negative regulatory protein RseA
MTELQTATASLATRASCVEPEGLARREVLSAWVDAEASLDSASFLADDAAGSDEALDIWHRYHLIGDVLRAQGDVSVALPLSALSASHARAMAQHIMAKAGGEPLHPTPVIQEAPVSPMREAANDAVFRWKMVAGIATMAAVLSVAWGVSGVSPGAAGPGAVLAQADHLATPTPSAVLVSTPNGPVLRDPRLEALMLAHRQAGGASALQVPAGFLRNATFDATQR